MDRKPPDGMNRWIQTALADVILPPSKYKKKRTETDVIFQFSACLFLELTYGPTVSLLST
jgi:hypothetical protein